MKRRHAHTDCVRPIALAFLLGALGATPFSGAPARADTREGHWQSTGSMKIARENHSATLLADGRVLVVGGFAANPRKPLSSAEVYDPSTGTWETAGKPKLKRVYTSAVLLEDGRVLVMGGFTKGMRFAQLYDPTTNAWARAGNMGLNRFAPMLFALDDGTVLVAGGDASGAESYQFYDPRTATFGEPIRAPSFPQGCVATRLPDGRILVAGGVDPATHLVTDRAQIFDPATRTFSAAAPLLTARRDFNMMVLPNSGQVLVAGGASDTDVLLSSELFDPVAGTWRPTGDLGALQFGSASVALDGDTALVAEGSRTFKGPFIAVNTSEVYALATGQWTDGGDTLVARGGATATRLQDGRVLVVGGHDGGTFTATSACELYTP